MRIFRSVFMVLVCFGVCAEVARAESLVPFHKKFLCERALNAVFRLKDENYNQLSNAQAKKTRRNKRRKSKQVASKKKSRALRRLARNITKCLKGNIPSACSYIEGVTSEESQSIFIVNGDVCDKTNSPVVELSIHFGVGLCTGTVISNDPLTILSAAHCVNDPAFGGIAADVAATVGGETFVTTDLNPHPSYVPEDNSSLFDISVIVFDETTSVEPLSGFQSGDKFTSPVEVIAAGFGNTTPGVSTPSGADGELRAAHQLYLGPDDADLVTQYVLNFSNICTGDSGGPLLREVKTAEGEKLVRIVGTSSLIIIPEGAEVCGVGNFGVFPDLSVSAYLSFIEGFVPGFGS